MAILRQIYFPECVRAEEETRVLLCFAGPIEDTDKTILQCHIYDDIFNVDYYLPDISIGSLEVATVDDSPPKRAWTAVDGTFLPNIRIAKLKFPEALAGGRFLVEFLIQYFPEEFAAARDPYEIALEDTSYASEAKASSEEQIRKLVDLLVQRSPSDSSPTSKFHMRGHNVEKNYFQSYVEVVSREPQAPKIESVYWGKDEEITFGELSKARTNTKVGKNETLFLHVHTRGLYGREILVKPLANKAVKVRVKDNTVVFKWQLWFWISQGYSIDSRQITAFAGLYAKKKDGTLDTARAKWKRATPKLTYDPKRITPISPSTSAVTVSAGGRGKPEIYSEARCMVEFRPSPRYAGDFGFSWFRKGDLQLRRNTYSGYSKRLDLTISTLNSPSNDHDFSQIMGHHYERVTKGGHAVEYIVQDGNRSSSHALFKTDAQMYRNHSLDYYRILMKNVDEQKYHIPYMTLRAGVEAELSLHITVKDQPEKLIYRFNHPKALSEGYMTINGSSTPYEDLTPPSPTTTPDISRTIRIKCLKEFSKPLRLEVYAQAKDSEKERLCGAVHIFPNDVSHQRKIKVVFFNVVTNIDGKDPLYGIAENDTSKLDILRKYLGQAYVIPEITVEELDLVDKSTNLTDAGYLACCIPKKDEEGVYTSVDPNKDRDLAKFLLQATEGKYENYFKVFFIGDSCLETGGFSTGEKFTVCFSSANPSTPAHELGHALGLPHTFDGSTSRAKYVYEEGMTDNIMDYSHDLGIARHSFFHWQWHIMNIRIG